jgi:CTP synthase
MKDLKIVCIASQKTMKQDCIAEIGGTVGDMEGLPFLEAMRQVSADVGRKNCMFYTCYTCAVYKRLARAKTKPTQHSTKRFTQSGIQPDVIVCRCEGTMPKDVRRKIALFCNVSYESVILNSNVESIL